ncbi:Uncharacterised protein [Serratia rubidaea]|uniref:Uncharacterized protein n=1 Tax=Serratia rubidaea TaxID=61652 RepID=A0A4U9HAA6_SERRU|nr:Uncharacterised protein [Serratia rubidaea]
MLQTFPHATFYLDIKSPDADPARFADALLTTLEEQHALARTRIYSTDARYLQALPPQIARFVSRDETRSLLANVAMAHRCQLQPHDATPRWYGLELTREVEVVEKYTLAKDAPRRSSAGMRNQCLFPFAGSGADCVIRH